MRSPLTHVGQTAQPEHPPQQQQQDHQGTGQQQDAASSDAGDAPSGAEQHQQRQTHFSRRITELHEQKDRQRQAGTEDPASDANTESANRPNDE